MSVYASKRQESKIKFLQGSQEIVMYTAKQMKKFPKTQRHSFANNIMKLSLEIQELTLKASSISLYKDTSPLIFQMRQKYLIEANSSIFALGGLLTTTLSLLLEGNNFFGTREETLKIFADWSELLNQESELIEKTISSDQEIIRLYSTTKPNNL